MNRTQWLEMRKRGIGGSDAAAVCNLSPWVSRYRLWAIKTGQAEDDPENEAMRMGSLLEPVIRQRYVDETGYTVKTYPLEIFQHDTIDFMLASVDGLPVEVDVVLECKTARSKRGWGEPGTDEVPLHYRLQGAHYMAVMDRMQVDYAVLFGDFDFAIYHLERDYDLEDSLIEEEREFWQLVLDRTPPDELEPGDALIRWPDAVPAKTASGGPEERGVATALSVAKDFNKRLEVLIDKLSGRLKVAIGDSEALEIDGDIVATWKNAATPARFDTAAFRVAHPDIYAQFVRPAGKTRRFLLKGAKCLETSNQTKTNIFLPRLLAEPDSSPSSEATDSLQP